MSITRTPIVDDDGSRTTGTVIGNTWKQELYDQIDAADLAAVGGTLATTGTWTPTIGGSTSQSGQTYANQIGVYLKIGPLVCLQADLSLSAVGTITGTVQIKGLPFAAKTTAARAGMMIPYFTGMTTSVIWMGGFIASGSSAISMTYRASAGAAISSLVQTDLGASLETLFSCIYMTD